MNPEPAQAYVVANATATTSTLVPVRKQRPPNERDVMYPDGKLWVDTSADTIYGLTSKTTSDGLTTANWVLLGAVAGDIETITGDSGGAVTPTLGNVDLLGGTNITTVGTPSTLTFNLDDAIVVATSVTTPLVVSPGGSALTLQADGDEDLILKMGDAAAANKVSFVDSADAEVASLDSDGALTVAGLLTASASAIVETAGATLSLGADNSADAVILGGGTSARAITIGQDAAAHTIAIGQAAAGAITVDTAAGVSIDAAAASNFSVSGAGIDLTLASAAGRVVVNGEEAADDAVRVLSAAGGLDVDVALQLSLVSSEAAADAIVLNASDAAGGIDLLTGGGEISISSAGSVSMMAGTQTVANPTASATENTRVGSVRFTGFTTAAGADEDFTITNSTVTATNAIFVTVTNTSAGNDADMTIEGIRQAAGSFELHLINNGAAALDGDVLINWWVIN